METTSKCSLLRMFMNNWCGKKFSNTLQILTMECYLEPEILSQGVFTWQSEILLLSCMDTVDMLSSPLKRHLLSVGTGHHSNLLWSCSIRAECLDLLNALGVITDICSDLSIWVMFAPREVHDWDMEWCHWHIVKAKGGEGFWSASFGAMHGSGCKEGWVRCSLHCHFVSVAWAFLLTKIYKVGNSSN